MWQRLIELNQRIEIEILEGPYQGSYFSHVVDKDGEYLEISIPTSKGDLVPVREETRLNVIFVGPEAMYQFSSTVLRRVREGKVYALIIAPPERIERIQRREFFRLDVSIPFMFRRQEEDEEFIPAHTVDLSGGGLKFRSEERLEEGETLLVRFEEEQLGELLLELEILRRDKGDDLYTYAAEFKEILENEQDAVIGYIFDKQRELKKKGLL